MIPSPVARPLALLRLRALSAPAALCLLLACDAGSDVPAGDGGPGTGAAAEDTGDAPGGDARSAADRLVAEGLVPAGRTREEIRATLGEPDSVAREAVANRHVPNQTDTIVSLHYPDLVATVYAITGGRDLLQSVRVSDDAHLRDPLVRIGMPWEEARAALGEPVRRDGGVRVYECRSCTGAENPVRIHVADGIVRAVEFTYYVD